MFPVIVYILGCFSGGLYLKSRDARALSRFVLASGALLCVWYLAAGQTALSGFSLFSLSPTAVPQTESDTAPWKAPIPGPSSLLHVVDSTLSRPFAGVSTLYESAAAVRVGFALYLLGAAAILWRPRYGLYLILFFALVGDEILLPWYPFAKGFSSPESLFFIHDWFIVSPLEIYIALTAVSWSARWIRQRPGSLRTGRLFRPAVAFAAALVFGLAYGLGAGGDLRIALWEARAVFYLVPLLLLTSNLVDTPAHVTTLLWAALAAVFVKGVYGSLYYLLVLRGDLNGVESIAQHGAAIHLNAILVSAFAVWMYETSLLKRVLLALMLPFIVLGYIAMQRRAAFITAAIAIVLILVPPAQTTETVVLEGRARRSDPEWDATSPPPGTARIRWRSPLKRSSHPSSQRRRMLGIKAPTTIASSRIRTSRPPSIGIHSPESVSGRSTPWWFRCLISAASLSGGSTSPTTRSCGSG